RELFLGLGAGAASNLRGLFAFNTFSVVEYIRACQSNRHPRAFEMAIGERLSAVYWLYWRLYEGEISEAALLRRYGPQKTKQLRLAVALFRALGLLERREGHLRLTEPGAFWIHLMQNHYVLNYIDTVWSVARAQAWPEKIEL
ncbi:MAG: hypothetical protein PHS14_06635, partial [Elusimicrobia bacterium]|nr:hypothetical protein [Elusimicrobiota bacterium]